MALVAPLLSYSCSSFHAFSFIFHKFSPCSTTDGCSCFNSWLQSKQDLWLTALVLGWPEANRCCSRAEGCNRRSHIRSGPSTDTIASISEKAQVGTATGLQNVYSQSSAHSVLPASFNRTKLLPDFPRGSRFFHQVIILPTCNYHPLSCSSVMQTSSTAYDSSWADPKSFQESRKKIVFELLGAVSCTPWSTSCCGDKFMRICLGQLVPQFVPTNLSCGVPTSGFNSIAMDGLSILLKF